MDVYDAATRALHWDGSRGSSTADLLRLLRLHAGTLQQLHVT
jgi:hypothetical protein